MEKWHYEKDEIRNTPSVRKGMPLETEQRYRREGARFVMDLGTTLKVSFMTMATGAVYFHRFYMVHTFQEFPRYPTACACLLLAGKVEETPKKCKDISVCAQELLHGGKIMELDKDSPLTRVEQEENFIRKFSEHVMTLERILLYTIKFGLQVDHPYPFIVSYGKCLKGNKSKIKNIVQVAWTLTNDSFCTTICLQWQPEIIAIAMLYLAGKLTKFEVVDWNDREIKHACWWDMFVEDLSPKVLDYICHQVLDLLEVYSGMQDKSLIKFSSPHTPRSPLPSPNAANVSPTPTPSAIPQTIGSGPYSAHGFTPPLPPPPPPPPRISNSFRSPTGYGYVDPKYKSMFLTPNRHSSHQSFGRPGQPSHYSRLYSSTYPAYSRGYHSRHRPYPPIVRIPYR